MSQSHSPAPWSFNGDRYVTDAAGNVVCQMSDVGSTVPEHENRPNGRLIEQSPLLLREVRILVQKPVRGRAYFDALARLDAIVKTIDATHTPEPPAGGEA